MYFVNNKTFNELFDAIDYCKKNPRSVLKNENGTVLMKYKTVSLNTFLEIELAKKVLIKQQHNIN